MTYWRAVVERPDGDGGWAVVGVFGAQDSPGGHTSQHLHGDTALDAARLLLSHVWPVDLAEANRQRSQTPDRWVKEDQAKTGIADHRITLTVDETRTWSMSSRPVPDSATFTVAELRLATVRTTAASLAEARATLRALNEQIRTARGDVRHFGFLAEAAVEEAARAGVAAAEVAKARRLPRQPRKARPGSNGAVGR